MPDLGSLPVLRLLGLVKLTRYSGALSRLLEIYRLWESALADQLSVEPDVALEIIDAALRRLTRRLADRLDRARCDHPGTAVTSLCS